MRPDATLLQSFLDARYLVTLPDGQLVQIVIGHATPVLDQRTTAQQRCWALLNPGSPRSAPWPDALNTARMRTLQQLLRQRRISALAAESHADDGSFSERGVLLENLELREVDALACRFGQHAVITGSASQVATLRCYGPGWP